MIITFCGHREVNDEKAVESWLREVIKQLLQNGEAIFYLGGYGTFDCMAARIIQEYKQYAAGTESIFVLPYLNVKTDLSLYDNTIYPPLENTPSRFAVLKRNQWMVDEADLIIAYVQHNWGGVAKMLEYAYKRKKKTVTYPNTLQL